MHKSQAEVIYKNTLPATFVKRNNRFTAEVMVEGKVEKVHVKNTGRLGELLLPGAQVTLQKSDNPNRKTAYDLISVYKEGLEWVNIDSLVPNTLMRLALEGDGYDLVKPEYTYGDSRVDFYMEKDGKQYLREVKGCTLAVDAENEKEKSTAGPQVGCFPDAPTERGIKHLNELAQASGKGIRCSIAFVIQMNGITKVIPNDKTQPEFGIALANAQAAGVEVVYYACQVEADRIRIVGHS